jgi:hypothetical protein
VSDCISENDLLNSQHNPYLRGTLEKYLLSNIVQNPNNTKKYSLNTNFKKVYSKKMGKYFSFRFFKIIVPFRPR